MDPFKHFDPLIAVHSAIEFYTQKKVIRRLPVSFPSVTYCSDRRRPVFGSQRTRLLAERPCTCRPTINRVSQRRYVVHSSNSDEQCHKLIASMLCDLSSLNALAKINMSKLKLQGS